GPSLPHQVRADDLGEPREGLGDLPEKGDHRGRRGRGLHDSGHEEGVEGRPPEVFQQGEVQPVRRPYGERGSRLHGRERKPRHGPRSRRHELKRGDAKTTEMTATALPMRPSQDVDMVQGRRPESWTPTGALGFPNPGIDEFIRNLRSRGEPHPPLIASISGKTLEDVVAAYARVQPHVEGVEVNLSSPNTPSLRDLREPSAFAELAQRLRDA